MIFLYESTLVNREGLLLKSVYKPFGLITGESPKPWLGDELKGSVSPNPLNKTCDVPVTCWPVTSKSKLVILDPPKTGGLPSLNPKILNGTTAQP